MITAEQVVHYQTFGFLALRQAFKRDEMVAIGRTFDELLDQERQGRPFAGAKRP